MLDAALDRPAADRRAFVAAACSDDEALRRRVEYLLDLAERDDGFLDRSPLALTGPATPGCPSSLEAGARLGAFRLVRCLGAGGMGEVWLGERVEGGFSQQVAIKCLHTESPSLLTRFEAERTILAGLTHPSIARLYDGGVTADGRPYMVMEYVDGENILAWCANRRASLDTRLALFLDVCDAAAHAHTHLVVHRDLKPANILVTPDGGVKLLDFGIARLLQHESIGDATLTAHLSPAYAAPEQLSGRPISTATDVHALGATLYQLLTGALPWAVTDLPLGMAVQRLLTTVPVVPSRVSRPDAPVPPRLVRGDLDAIVSRALRHEPHERYPDARALADDVRRFRHHEPVQARSGARTYVTRRFVRRHWRPVAAAALLFAALAAGLVGIAWQAERAEQEAARATAIREYLESVFKASDPRIASDQPRGQITARELLDLGAARIDGEFAGQPALRIELLDLTAGIYRELGESDRYADLHARAMALARQHYGEAHPVVIRGLLRESDDAVLRHDYADARRLVEAIEPLIRQARLDGSTMHARWWLRRGNALEADASRWDDRMAALNEAVRLFEATDPGEPDFVVALGNLAAAHWEGDRPDAAVQTRDWLRRAVAAGERARARDDGALQVLYANLGHVETTLGEAEGADKAFGRAAELARTTYGENNRRYWHATALWAGALHSRGERVRALQVFDELRARLPDEPTIDDQDIVSQALTIHGSALIRDGRPGEAVPLLEAAERGYLRANRGYRLGFLHRMLGEAYEGVGRNDDARRQFALSLESTTAPGSDADGVGVLSARERWARFLLAQGEIDAAAAEFRDIVAPSAEAPLLAVALAHAGLASVALHEGDADRAVAASRQALSILDGLTDAQDVRTAPYLWTIHARALHLAGDLSGARDWARRALEAYRRYTHPSSANVADVEAFIEQLATAAFATL